MIPTARSICCRFLTVGLQPIKSFAESYYEKKLDIDAIEHIYRHEILTTKIISRLNGEITLQSLTSDMEEIDYPRLISNVTENLLNPMTRIDIEGYTAMRF